ncbi:MAG: hypothetical protein HWN66_12455 [Candidatus Helarchaeota archaeon]|nr:hypothetical protein [Candidatus Helarchaeota archaeon]
MVERNEHGERINPRIYVGSKIVGYLYLGLSMILIVQGIISLLSVYGIIQVMPFSEYLSGPEYIVDAFEGFFLMNIILIFAFAAIGIICTVGILKEQEWGGGISLVLMGLVALTMVVHFIINPGIFGSLNLVLEIIIFGIALFSSMYVIRNFKRFD